MRAINISNVVNEINDVITKAGRLKTGLSKLEAQLSALSLLYQLKATMNEPPVVLQVINTTYSAIMDTFSKVECDEEMPGDHRLTLEAIANELMH